MSVDIFCLVVFFVDFMELIFIISELFFGLKKFVLNFYNSIVKIKRKSRNVKVKDFFVILNYV